MTAKVNLPRINVPEEMSQPRGNTAMAGPERGPGLALNGAGCGETSRKRGPPAGGHVRPDELDLARPAGRDPLEVTADKPLQSERTDCP